MSFLFDVLRGRYLIGRAGQFTLYLVDFKKGNSLSTRFLNIREHLAFSFLGASFMLRRGWCRQQ